MNVNELGFSDNINKFLEAQKYTSLYPYQKEAITKGLLDDKNMLISAPTGNGKTLIGMLTTINHIKKYSSKIIYLVPTRALANEKHREFSKLKDIKIGNKFPKIIKRIGGTKLSLGDIENNDMIIMTNEMLYFGIQKEPDMLTNITLLIIDEIYLINDQKRRGSILEILSTLFKLNEIKQIIALCPMIDNANEIADWLNATCIKTTNRITKIKKMIYYDKELKTTDGDHVRYIVQSYPKPFIDLSIEYIKDEKQVLMFTTKKKDVMDHTSCIHQYIQPHLSEQKRNKLKIASDEILDFNDNTKIVCKLAEYVRNGAAFHHAELSEKCLTIIEREVRSKNIMFLACSKTLIDGVNFPIYSVIIANTETDKNHSTKLIYQQICGRAARPQYHTEGECIIIDDGSGNGLDNYIANSIGKLESQLSINSYWKNYIIDIIRLMPNCDKNYICKLLSNTINGKYFKNPSIMDDICKHITILKKYNMITETNECYTATKFGAIPFSSLSPEKADEIRGILKKLPFNKSNHIELIYLLSQHIDHNVYSTSDHEIKNKIVNEQNNRCLNLTEENIDTKMIILYMLISEYSDNGIEDNYHVKQIQYHSNELLDEIKEIALYIKRRNLYFEIKKLKKCIQYNVKMELLDLMQFDEIGGIRARALYDNGIKNLEDVNDASEQDLSKIDKITINVSKIMKEMLRKGIRAD